MYVRAGKEWQNDAWLLGDLDLRVRQHLQLMASPVDNSYSLPGPDYSRSWHTASPIAILSRLVRTPPPGRTARAPTHPPTHTPPCRHTHTLPCRLTHTPTRTLPQCEVFTVRTHRGLTGHTPLPNWPYTMA